VPVSLKIKVDPLTLSLQKTTIKFDVVN
jgi:hypothetical protein